MSTDEECILKIFSERWDGHIGENVKRNGTNYDEYYIKRTTNGWYIKNIEIDGQCDKTGDPILYRNLRQDHISYPSNLPEIMRLLWEAADKEKLTKEKLQHELDKISNWINECEMNKPHFKPYY